MAEKKGYNRRDFLKIIGATSGVAATGCAQELPEKLLPYVVQPDEVIPGVAAWYSGSCGECSAGCGVLVRTREGRVTKVEGNAGHPINRGGLCSRGQSAVQSLYDPDRVREPLKRGVNGAFKPISWSDANSDLAKQLSAVSKSGKEIAFVTRGLGPSETALFQKFSSNVKGVAHYEYSLLEADALKVATANLFGSTKQVRFDFSKADAVFGVGADYLETWHSPVEQTKGFASKRRPHKGPHKKTTISTVYHVEPRLSLTAANADVWLKNVPGSEHRVLQALLVELVTGKYSVSSSARSSLKAAIGSSSAKDLLKGTGVSLEKLQKSASALAKAENSLVLAGGASTSGSQAVLCAELAFCLNYLLGNLGKTVLLSSSPSSAISAGAASLDSLVKKLEAGQTAAVVFVDVNPVYSAPAARGLQSALSKASLLVHLGCELNETAVASHFALPGLTNFESWNDSEPQSGIVNLNQPAMQPLYEGQSFGDFLLALGSTDDFGVDFGKVESFYDYLKLQWKSRLGSSNFEKSWISAVERGGLWSAAATQNGLSPKIGTGLMAEHSLPKSGSFSLIAFPTVNLGDGSAANRPWAQEVPDPMSTAVWGSWIEMHPHTAARKKLSKGDVVRLRTAHGSIEAPVFISEHIDEHTVAVPIGQGHEGFGRYASGVGANVLEMLPVNDGAASFVAHDVSFDPSVASEELVITQGHDSQLDRGLTRTVAVSALSGAHDDHGHGDSHGAAHSGAHAVGGTAAAYGLKEFHHHDPHELGPLPEPKQMYKQMDHVQYAWGMSVDLASCTGCSACVTACYAENNVPVVGKDLCVEGREMSWIRIERYLDGTSDSPVTGFSPVMCQHCNNAPCEPVCPVYATYHSEDGLNTMVYNRCVGTRYCGNNCSYKVRRFNWFKYEFPEPLNWQLNPDVTVRSVGVMEKCSFCIQRIREGQNTAKDLGRPVQDGEVQTACASSCPADAITFGNLNDKNSQVYKNTQNERSYRMLNVEINTQPAVYYMAKAVHSDGKKSTSHS